MFKAVKLKAAKKAASRAADDEAEAEAEAAGHGSSSSSSSSMGGNTNKAKPAPVIALREGWGENGTVDMSQPMLIRNQVPGLKAIKDERQRFARDVDLRPDSSSQQYESVLIEDFGAAMLRGMGWKGDKEGKGKKGDKEGKGKGDGKEKSKAFVAEARPALLGLGAVPKPAWKKADEGKRVSASALAATWLCKYAVAKITQGKYQGEVAVVRQTDGVPGLNNCVVQLDPGADAAAVERLPEVVVKKDSLELLDVSKAGATHPGRVLQDRAKAQDAVDAEAAGDESADEDDDATRKRKRSRKRAREAAAAGDGGDGGDGGDAEAQGEGGAGDGDDAAAQEKRRKKAKKAAKKTEAKRPAHCWLRSGIRVRVVSKALAGGQYYAAKGVVQDVLDPVRCTCVLSVGGDSGNGGNGGNPQARTLEGVLQTQLDTALPKKGGRVVVLLGTHKGERGKLLERNSKKARATVQLDDSLEVHQLPYEHVAEDCFLRDADD